MTILFGNLESGNVHKVQLLLRRVGEAYQRVEVGQARGEARRREFLELNPMGKVPTVRLENGDVLSESGAILYFYGRSTQLWPAAARAQAEVLRWMFFEQYSHEPALAVARYRRQVHQERISADCLSECHRVLAIMDEQLRRSDWLCGESCTIADYSLYPYTKWAPEAGVGLEAFAAVRRWLGQVEEQPRFLPLRTEGAVKVLSFAEYFG